MPGSTFLGHAHGADAIEHGDAVRLAGVLHEMAALLAMSGPNRLTDAQVGALCGGRMHDREEFTAWVLRVARELDHRTQEARATGPSGAGPSR
ncbi:hypothetical protein ACWCP6_28965 [Streptomyces sp. NPDC002004]